MAGGCRLGAGRPAFRPSEAAYRSIQLRRLLKSGALKMAGFDWVWRDQDGDIVSSVSAAPSGDGLTFRFSQNVYGERRSFAIPVRFAWTGCHFGGRRRWFVCPNCAARCGRLFFAIGGIGCRRCLRVTYASQRGDPIDRLNVKLAKLEARLGGRGSDWDGCRPKGMHRRTFERLHERWVDLSSYVDALIADAAIRRFGIGW